MRLVKLLLRAIRLLDAFTDGAIADTTKVLLIEMLGDETMLEEGMATMGAGFMEVIVDERNQAVMDDLREVAASKDARRVAIFYGAAHMPDFAERLIALGYVRDAVTWHRAMEVDMESSVVDARTLAQLRIIVRRSMDFRKQPPAE